MKGKPKPLKDYFADPVGRQRSYRGECRVAKDLDEMMSFEHEAARVIGEGPSIRTLMLIWKNARRSWKRITDELPPCELKDEMMRELAEREAAIAKLQDEASDQLYAKLALEEGEDA
jgi:hypothetical protein